MSAWPAAALPALLPALLLVPAIAALALLGINLAIRYGLRAPRLVDPATPAGRGLPFSEVRIATVRGRGLRAWWIPPAGAKAAPCPALVVLHGWGGNAATMLPLAPPFHAAGYGLLLVEARNHGASDGDNFSSLPRFAEDMDSAVAWLQARPDVDARRIGLVGHSVGAAAALLAASRRRDIAAVVSIAAFAHPETLMRRYLAAKRVPYLPFGWYVLRYVQRVIGHRFADIAPLRSIAGVRCPVLLVHGLDDETVPADDARLIHSRRPDERTQLLLIAGSHDDYAEMDKGLDAALAFIDAAMQQAGVEASARATNDTAKAAAAPATQPAASASKDAAHAAEDCDMARGASEENRQQQRDDSSARDERLKAGGSAAPAVGGQAANAAARPAPAYS